MKITFKKGAAGALWLTALVGMFSCSAVYVPSETFPVADADKSAILENVPFYPQRAFQCGPAALAGVLTYQGIATRPEEIAETVFDKDRRGTLSLDMVLYARSRGIKAEWYQGSVADIYDNISMKTPLVVMVDQGIGPIRKPHFMVLIGYDSKGIFANSGRSEKKHFPWNRFLSQWNRTDRWILKVHPEDGL